MYDKIAELCETLNKMPLEDLHKNDIESIAIFAWKSDDNNVVVSKGRFEYLMAMIGQTLSRISKKSGRPLKELLDGIYECETEIERIEKEGESKWNGAL
jgi:hypothetical protein